MNEAITAWSLSVPSSRDPRVMAADVLLRQNQIPHDDLLLALDPAVCHRGYTRLGRQQVLALSLSSFAIFTSKKVTRDFFF